MAAIIVLHCGGKSMNSASINHSSRQSQSSNQVKICPDHKFKTCKREECQFNHPQKCDKIVKHGLKQFNEEGCDMTCGLFHPWVCHKSMKYKECQNIKCKRVHLPGTKRLRKPINTGYNWTNFYPQPWNMLQNQWYGYHPMNNQLPFVNQGKQTRTRSHQDHKSGRGGAPLINSARQSQSQREEQTAHNVQNESFFQGFHNITEHLKELTQSQRELSQHIAGMST